jgi:hypothetical protein
MFVRRLVVVASMLSLSLIIAACGGVDPTSRKGVDAGSVDEVDAGFGPYPAAHPAPPQVVTSGGPVLASPEIFSVFFSNDDSAFVGTLDDFGQKLGATAYWATLGEYGVGPATGSSVQLTESATGNIDDSTIQTWLAGKLNGNDPAWIAPDANTVYVLYYPAGVTITNGGAKSCQAFGGYHSNILVHTGHGNINAAYAVIPRCASGHGLTGIDVITAAASHELAEAATDPYPNNKPAYGQVDDADIYWELALGGPEIGDMCAQSPASYAKFPDLPDYTVQRVWSNEMALEGHDPCVPSLDGEVYANAAPVLPDTLTVPLMGRQVTLSAVKIPVGTSETIDVSLFSDAPTLGPWTVQAVDFTGGGSELSFSFDRTTGVNGDVLKLTITHTAAGSQGGSLFLLESNPGTANQQVWFGAVSN